MSQPVKSKIFASDTVDELLDVQSKQDDSHWLLSYLDVFVLVVMLMVTLLSISDMDVGSTPPVNQKTVASVAQGGGIQINEPVKMAVVKPSPPNPQKLEKPELRQVETTLDAKIKDLGLEHFVQMTLTKGSAQFDIKEEVLFQSSTAEMTDAGETLLTRLIPLLKETPGLIAIEGHTDNRPINTAQFHSNWELSAARATSVVHFLSAQIDSTRLRAVSYADTKPVAENDTAEGRERNRRVNIIIQLENETQQLELQ